jgi:IclR family acetate operon transcriptional repressor
VSPMAGQAGTQSIERAAQLLVHVVENPEPTSVGALAETTGLPKSTTSRLVRALERQGLVQRDGARGSFSPGPVLLRYARRSLGEEDLVAVSEETVRSLAESSGETVNLAVATLGGVEHLLQRDSRHFLGGTNWVGRLVPFHCSANGKVLLAFGAAPMPPGPLERRTPRTIVTAARLADELETVRERGFATAVEELEPGLAAVAAPVRGPDGAVVAALSVSGPTVRLTAPRLEALGVSTREHADRLSSLLASRQPKRGVA